MTHERPMRGQTVEWFTPKYILMALGPFQTDPCCAIDRPWPTAKVMWDTYGLEREWVGRVWLNPPYGPNQDRWILKLAEHGNGFALVFARTETDWFQNCVWDKADAILFLKGRVRFYTPDGKVGQHSSGSPSVVVAYGKKNVNRLRDCGLPGQYIKLRRKQHVDDFSTGGVVSSRVAMGPASS